MAAFGCSLRPNINEINFSDEPRNAGITQDLAIQVTGCTCVASMFAYAAPQFGFNPSEQRLMLSALREGETDEGLAVALGISVSAVKKSWRSIYRRVADRNPDLFPAAHSLVENEIDARGRQKKQRILAYLREHPEELRPFSRKWFPDQRGRPHESRSA